MNALKEKIAQMKQSKSEIEEKEEVKTKRLKFKDEDDEEEEDEEEELEEEEEENDKGKEDKNPDPDSQRPSFPQDKSSERTMEKNILDWMEDVLLCWESDLARKEIRTASDRQLFSAFKESQFQLQPLFQLLRERTLPTQILYKLNAIVDRCKVREYRQAFDLYIQLTIGNAPWPIGVTMVGIHARSGREKIAQDKISHLMKNDTARAYMVSFKRLMTRSQVVFPPDTPSKTMN